MTDIQNSVSESRPRITRADLERQYPVLNAGLLLQPGHYPDLQGYASAIRALNAYNGWGLDFDPDSNREQVGSFLALIHSELSEAFDATDPQDTVRELGDVIVRALDLCELLIPGAVERAELGQVHPRRLKPKYHFTEFNWHWELCRLHGEVSAALECYRKVEDWRPGVVQILMRLIRRVWAVMKYASLDDVDTVLVSILCKNMNRGYRYGGRRV